MKPIFFTKMEGSGNDFVILNNHTGLLSEFIPSSEITGLVQKLSDRNLGAGADGVLIVEGSKDFPFEMKYYNKDGSEAEICLNGARCIVSYAYRLGLIQEKGKFMSGSGPIGFFQRNGTVSIEVLPPVDIKLNFSITVKRKKYKVSYLRIGVPHCVMLVDSFDDIDIPELGEKIRNLKTFQPDGVNVNFVTHDKNRIYVRTYERGVEDETLSCGSGVLASAYIATKLFIADSPITVDTRGGQLQAIIKDKLYLEGPAKFVFDGVYYVE